MLPATTQGHQTGLQWGMHFTPNPRCVPLVRRLAGNALRGWGFEQHDVDRVLLVCSELATNAIQHAHRSGDGFSVRLTVSMTCCLVEVSDAEEARPRRQHAQADEECGRGLQLVDALSEETGHVATEPDGKTVWARLLLTSPEGATGA